MAAVLFTCFAVPMHAAQDSSPFGNTPIKQDKTVRGEEDIDVATVTTTTTTIDTIADISDACSGRDDSDTSADEEDKKTFSELLGGNKDDNSGKKSDTDKKDNSSGKKDSGSNETVRDRIDSATTNEKTEKFNNFANKYMKHEGDSDSTITTEDILNNNDLHPEDAESFKEFNLQEEKGKKPEDF